MDRDAGQRSSLIQSVSRKVRTRRATCDLAFYIVGRWRLESLEDRTQLIDEISKKYTNLCSNYRQYELEMCVLSTEWLLKPSHQVQGIYNDIECKQPTSVLLEASKHIYGHQNTAWRTRTRLKWWHCAIPVWSFVIQCLLNVISNYAVLLRELAMVVSVITIHAVRNVGAPHEQVLGAFQICSFSD